MPLSAFCWPTVLGGHGARLSGRVVAPAGRAGHRGGALQLPLHEQAGAGWQTQTAGQATRAAGALAPDGEGVCASPAVSGRQVDGRADGGRTLSGWRGRDECCRIAHSRVSFPPPGQPDRWRGDVLKQIKTPTLLLQGERDTFGTRAELADFPFSPAVSVHWLTDGDHGFKPRKSSGVSEQDNLRQAAGQIKNFIATIPTRT